VQFVGQQNSVETCVEDVCVVHVRLMCPVCFLKIIHNQLCGSENYEIRWNRKSLVQKHNGRLNGCLWGR